VNDPALPPNADPAAPASGRFDRDRILNTIGLVLLLACFVVALVRVFGRVQEEADPDRPVLRFAHWQLEAGIRAAMDALAEDYMRLHPGVRVVQLAVPERTYETWVRTNLVGGTAPELIQLGKGTNDEVLARFYEPITALVAEPNPYNRGTDLEHLPWQDTFVDGLQGYSYNANLMENFAIPITMFTTRVFYNRDLWRRILGDTPEPATYDEFVAICERVHAWSQSEGRFVLPVAGSRYSAPPLIDRVFSSQTQRLAASLDRAYGMKASQDDFALGLVAGRWSLDTPAVRDGIAAKPGFVQLGREDATFYFVQQRALMIATGSWDAPSLRFQAPFEIGVFPVPLPARDHPRFGPNVLGRPSEAGTAALFPFGLTRQAKNRELAIDFLRFISSREGNRRFVERSGWLPAVVGVELPEPLRPFAPVADGYPDGYNLKLNFFGPDTTRVVDNNLNLLAADDGEARFLAALQRDYRRAVVEDFRVRTRRTLQNVARQDSTLESLRRLSVLRPDDPSLPRKLRELSEGQGAQEALYYWVEHELAVGAAANSH
jgi:raffinose/stachyose/melibiose transport system substrate-binding protein